MKKLVILTLGFLGGAFVLSLLIMQGMGKGVPGKQFISTSLWDPVVIHLAMTAAIIIVFLMVWGVGKIIAKKLNWGKWKTGLVYSLGLLFWTLIFWMAYIYSIRMIMGFSSVPVPLSVGPLMLSLKAFVFYFLRNVLILAIAMHVLLCAGWFLARRLKKSRVDK
ncbi:MAG: hypothetical protein EHM45_24050 [Desulfobacteraceae bacterium]|nr:MAG: hypothetical protein EHM45_24050 [Desulfobacteraceae bacterium]